jgi:hypothetical protein
MTKPNSDQSSRATRRRQTKALEKAQRVLEVAQDTPQPIAPPRGVSVSINDLLRKVGLLTMENGALKDQLGQRNEQITSLAKQLATQAGSGGAAEVPAGSEEEPSQ